MFRDPLKDSIASDRIISTAAIKKLRALHKHGYIGFDIHNRMAAPLISYW
jgi:hypothetical protein